MIKYKQMYEGEKNHEETGSLMEHGRLQDHSEEGGYGSQHRWASTSISMSEISDIDISYSDIGDKYVGLKNVIPISEVFRYRHQSSFRYPTLKKKIISP
jgi:hypothetical protein